MTEGKWILKTNVGCLSVLLAVVVLVCMIASCGIVTGETLMEYRGYEITEAMYSYWVSSFKTKFLATYSAESGSEEFWDTPLPSGGSYGSFFTDFVYDYAKRVLVSMYLFDELGLEFSDEIKAEVKQRVDDLVLAYGTKSELNSYLADYNLNIKTLERIYYAQEKVTVVTEALFGSKGQYAVTSEDMVKYYKDNYYCFDRIYLYTEKKPARTEGGDYVTDSSGQFVMTELTEQEKAEKAALVNQIMEKLKNGENFVSLRTAHSEEDLSKFDYLPNGVNVSANDANSYGMDFVKALQRIEVGEYTTCTDSYGTYIIARYALKEFADLSVQERNMMADFETYVFDHKAQLFFDEIEVTSYPEIMAEYYVDKAKALTNMNI